MRIHNLINPESIQHEGLKIKEMHNLKTVVAIFGKNGAGKTRFLNGLVMDIHSKTNELRDLHVAIGKFHGKKELTPQEHEQKMAAELALESFKINYDFEHNDQAIVLQSNLGIAPYNQMHDAEYREVALTLTHNPSYDQVRQGCMRLIKSLCKSDIFQQFHENVPNKKFFSSHDEIQTRNIKVLVELKKLIKEVINKELDYYLDEHGAPILTFNNQQFRVEELSRGEQELLMFVTYMVLQQQDDIKNGMHFAKNKIVIIDEPEMFLHPEAQIIFISGLRKIIGDGQLFIASHSLSILSILDRDEIWLMENSQICSPSIETPSKVLNSLIGETNIDALENFLSSQYEWASIQFAMESLLDPNVVPHKLHDPQQEQIVEALANENENLKILDFGSGRGRMAMELIRNMELARRIYFQAYEINPLYHDNLNELCASLQKISVLDPTSPREVLSSLDKLHELKYHNFYDRILLINVLHEISPSQWEITLNCLLNCLSEKGTLIFLEDQAIPRGELAHEYGFIILDLPAIKLLFNLEQEPKHKIHTQEKYSTRLTYIEIPKQKSVVTKQSIEAALRLKKLDCESQIKMLRGKSVKKSGDGRKHAFYTQSYANIDMVLTNEFKPN